MSVTRIPIDGLWRCLCPSIDLIASSSSIPIPVRASNVKARGRRNFHTGIARQWPAEAKRMKKAQLVNDGNPEVRDVPVTAEAEVKDEGPRLRKLVPKPSTITLSFSPKRKALALKLKQEEQIDAPNFVRVQWEKNRSLKPISTFSGDSRIPERVIDFGEKEKDKEEERRVRPIGAFAGRQGEGQGQGIPERGAKKHNCREKLEEGFVEGFEADGMQFSGALEDVRIQPRERFSWESVIPPRQVPVGFESKMEVRKSTGGKKEEVVRYQSSTFVDEGEAQQAAGCRSKLQTWDSVSTDTNEFGTTEFPYLDKAPNQPDAGGIIVEKEMQRDGPAQAFAEQIKTAFWPNSSPPSESSPYSIKVNDTNAADSLDEKVATTDKADGQTLPTTEINYTPTLEPTQGTTIPTRQGPSAMSNSGAPKWTAIPARRISATSRRIIDNDHLSIQDPHRHPTSHLTNSSGISFQQFPIKPREAEPNDSSVNKSKIGAPSMPHVNYDDVPLVHLHDRLRNLTMAKDGYFQICELVVYLLENRNEQPSLTHYDALIRANADAEVGDADVVKHLLQEMKELSIGPDSALYHGVLKVLAIHPDYLLREQVLQEMKIKWFGLSPEGWHNYVIGLIRDRQYEVAMDKLEQMHTDGIAVQPWLYDIFTFQLCDAGELDEVFKLLKHRFENTRHEISVSTWYYVLDAFTKAFYYEGTKYIWQKRIQTQKLVPSDGICTSALNMAARYADPGFATSIVRILSARMPILTPYHYEALLAAYAGSGDMKTAFRILAIMSKANMEPDTNTTRPIFVRLSESTEYPPEAWADLRSLSQDGHNIPVTAANVILEASCETRRFDQAVYFYKELHEIIPTGPNTDTFNTLLQGAVYAGRKDLCMFLASEMAALDIKPDRITYDRLILACLAAKDYEDAFKYLEEMVLVGNDKGDGGWWMRHGTAIAMARRCSAASDERAWKILEEMKGRGMNTQESWVTDCWGIEDLDGSFGMGDGARGERRVDSAMLTTS